MVPQLSPSFELAELQQRFLHLAHAVDRAIIGASRALADNDLVEAQRVVDGDAAIDRLRYALEADAVQLLAQQRHMMPDIRAIAGILLLAAELERIGDYAAGIAALLLRGADQTSWSTPAALNQMARMVRELLQQAIRAVVKNDAEAAAEIGRADDSVDRPYQLLVHELLATMRAQPELCERATYLLWVGHNLERAADRAVNIAERAAFIATGALAPSAA